MSGKNEPTLTEINLVQALLALRGALIEVIDELPPDRRKHFYRADGSVSASMHAIEKIMARWES